MIDMYPGMINSPTTELSSSITNSQTTISVNDASKLPDAPNLATIYTPGEEENAETIKYEGKSGNDLTSVTRGLQGTAKAWDAGTRVSRLFTAYDYDALRQNVETLDSDKADATDLSSHLADYMKQAIKGADVLGYGAKGDGETDDTTAIQDALDNKGIVILPEGYVFAVSTLNIPSNSVVIGHGATLKLLPNQPEMTPVVSLDGVSNVHICGVSVDGNKANQPGHIGEENGGLHGIRVVDSTDITISGVYIHSCEADGLYIGKGVDHSERVSVSNSVFTNNGRHGMAITSGRFLHFYKCEFSNSDTMDGVDIEHAPVCDNIYFTHCRFISNNGRGLVIHQAGQDRIAEYITVEGCYFDNLNTALRLTGASGENVIVRNIKILNNYFAAGSCEVGNPDVETYQIEITGNIFPNGLGRINPRSHLKDSIINDNLIDYTGNTTERLIDFSSDNSGLVIKNNILIGGERGITSSYPTENILIQGNVIKECAHRGVFLGNAGIKNCSITGNHISNCVGHGIEAWGSDCVFTNNVISNCDRPIRFSSAAKRNIVIGNIFKDNQNPLQGASGNYVNNLVEIWASGTSRPENPEVGQRYFDTDLGKPIWFDGTDWVDATGTIV